MACGNVVDVVYYMEESAKTIYYAKIKTYQTGP